MDNVKHPLKDGSWVRYGNEIGQIIATSPYPKNGVYLVRFHNKETVIDWLKVAPVKEHKVVLKSIKEVTQ